MLLYLNAAEAAVTFEVEGLDAVGGLDTAVAVDSGEGGVDAVVDTDALGDAYLHSTEAAVDDNDGTVADVGTSQVEADETKAGVHVDTFKTLTFVAVFLFTEGDIDFVHLAAVDGNGRSCRLFAVVAEDVALLVEKQQRDAPHHGGNANHILPDVVPRNDAAGGQKQQDADTEADDGACLVTVVEDVDETGNDDEQRPPTLKADTDDVEEFQGPDDAEGQKGDATDNFAYTIHFVC